MSKQIKPPIKCFLNGKEVKPIEDKLIEVEGPKPDYAILGCHIEAFEHAKELEIRVIAKGKCTISFKLKDKNGESANAFKKMCHQLNERDRAMPRLTNKVVEEQTT